MIKVVVIRGKDIDTVVKELDRYGITFKVLDIEEVDEESLINEIRNLPPQIRGRIRYGRGYPLPLSRSGRLNIKNTSILLIYEDNRLIDIYPKMLGSRYIDILEGIKNIVKSSPQYLFEEPLVLLISQHPELLGCKRCLGTHIIYKDIEIDVLLECNGEKTAVEVEDIVNEKAVSQALRISRYFKNVAIVGLKVESKALKAANKAQIKIFIVKLREEG